MIFNIEDNIRSYDSRYARYYLKGNELSLKDRDKIIKSNFTKDGYELFLTEKDLSDNKINVISIQNKKTDRENDLVLSVKKLKLDNTIYLKINTGNYVGVIQHKKKTYNIGSRFHSENNVFFQRMLSVANDVFIDDNSAAFSSSRNQIQEENIVEYIVHHSFLHSVLKADIIGVPKTYNYKRKESQVYKGRLDIATHINKNLPFIGKFSLIYGEQEFDETILHILYWALRIIQKRTFKNNNYNLNRILNKYKVLLQDRFKMDITLLNKIDSLKVLHNPIYSEYKKALSFAKQIITLDFNLSINEDSDVSGYLLNVAELWEIYLEKLLHRNLSNDGWEVSAQIDKELYNGKFFVRNIRPDLVLAHADGRIMVFDAKYKRMNMIGKKDSNYQDVDRTDFFQIHTYMAFFKENLIVGGLLYPFETKLDKNKCHSDNWIGGDAKFVIDGIDLSGLSKENDIPSDKEDSKDNIETKPLDDAEKAFIERIKVLASAT